VVLFRAWVDAFERLGYDVRELLGQLGLTRTDLDDPDLLIPCSVTGALFARSQHLRPLQNLWARLAAETPMGAFRLLDYLIVTADTVGQGFEQEARYFRLVGAPYVLDIRADEDPVRVVYVSNGPAAPSGVEYGVVLNVRGFRAETAHRVTFSCASFTHQPDDVRELEQLLDCEVRPGASWAGLALPRYAWQLPLERRDPILRNMLEYQADALAPRAPALEDALTTDVRRVLALRLARGEAEIDRVARDLAMSPRTLQRRLSSRGFSFHGLVDVLRRETAEKCITDASLSIAEIAYLAGYSEPAAFHRAFKRWTGCTPQAFRQRLRENPPASAF